jgi:hypothetical protein
MITYTFNYTQLKTFQVGALNLVSNHKSVNVGIEFSAEYF